MGQCSLRELFLLIIELYHLSYLCILVVDHSPVYCVLWWLCMVFGMVNQDRTLVRAGAERGPWAPQYKACVICMNCSLWMLSMSQYWKYCLVNITWNKQRGLSASDSPLPHPPTWPSPHHPLHLRSCLDTKAIFPLERNINVVRFGATGPCFSVLLTQVIQTLWKGPPMATRGTVGLNSCGFRRASTTFCFLATFYIHFTAFK